MSRMSGDGHPPTAFTQRMRFCERVNEPAETMNTLLKSLPPPQVTKTEISLPCSQEPRQ